MIHLIWDNISQQLVIYKSRMNKTNQPIKEVYILWKKIENSIFLHLDSYGIMYCIHF